jgi:hypothetical protein
MPRFILTFGMAKPMDIFHSGGINVWKKRMGMDVIQTVVSGWL